ncbi:hydantoinase/oxoprolinase family protein [Alkalibaculum sp. M08DMB]|uniref:Hydantoinase/oxoprolinase family protein n=1 Tax=Alkalibaculum sporogenes TaxID=2655001 RepID=A0A6A7KB29_9FIRM|nr:hydantoinase/oxoprolinase family protein [Alkalibaculum sporogenes]MPW26740.1 hydantoinase/oxoprolinase family protein [Alkalibaculum sporogenes]
MKIGIGIDTGGTYTDIVIYEFSEKEILFSAKALTTKQDLSIGIGNALDQLPSQILKQASLVSLSTTLATNACVEGIGGRGKLIFIGADKDVIDRTGKSYGLPDSSEIFFLDGEISYSGEIEKEPDWEAFKVDSKEWIKDADAIAVVQHLGIRNSGSEEKAKAIITKEYGLNTVCGHELFSDLNYVKRGSSTLLNARLIPVIEQFLDAIKKSLNKREILAPVVIVRSDGSLMSESFTNIRPVETLLCGPAASVMGGIELTGKKDCVIIDMGGTTTDMALVKDGIPVKARAGVKIGDWQTFVKAVYIDTFGLGGDSSVRVDKHGELSLGTSRVIPLSIAAKRWPQIIKKLNKLIGQGQFSFDPLHEFFCIVKDISSSNSYSKEELALCTALVDGPLLYQEAVELLQKRGYTSQLRRLESEGIIMRCGVTPTDIMHIKGDFCEFNTKAAELGVSYLSNLYNHLNQRTSNTKITIEDFCNKVYDLVKETLYFNIVRMLLEDKYENYKKNGIDENMEQIIKDSWKNSKDETPAFLNVQFLIPSASLVGVGAPIHLFLPDVAKVLGTQCVIPENAGVANAIGAIVGNIRVVHDIYVKPDDEKGFIVFCKSQNKYTDDYTEALEIATNEAKKEAIDEARRRGASGEITVTVNIDNSEAIKELASVFLSTTISVTAVGRISIGTN